MSHGTKIALSLLACLTTVCTAKADVLRQVDPHCLYNEARKQQLDPVLMLAIVRQEGTPMGMCAQNKNETCDEGLSGINTSDKAMAWLASEANMSQKRFRYLLANDVCFNLSVGAWMLREKINLAKGDIWKGVGYYNSRTPGIGEAYARKVAHHYHQICLAMFFRQQPSASLDKVRLKCPFAIVGL